MEVTVSKALPATSCPRTEVFPESLTPHTRTTAQIYHFNYCTGLLSWVLQYVQKMIVQDTKIQPDMRSDQGELPQLFSSAMATQVAVDHKRPKVRGWWQRYGGILSDVVIQHLVQDVSCWSTTRWGRGWGCPPGRRPALRTVEGPDHRRPEQVHILRIAFWNKSGFVSETESLEA